MLASEGDLYTLTSAASLTSGEPRRLPTTRFPGRPDTSSDFNLDETIAGRVNAAIMENIIVPQLERLCRGSDNIQVPKLCAARRAAEL
jgi:hypothetical protein